MFEPRGCLAGVAVMMLAACSSFGSTPSTGPEADSGVDAAVPADAGAPESFEGTLGNCGLWQGINASATLVDGGHTGAKACRVCSTGTGYFHITTPLPRMGANAQISVEAFVELDIATDLAQDVMAAVDIDGVFEHGPSAPHAAGWTKVSYIAVAKKAGAGLVADIASNTKVPGACFLVDDIVVRTEP